MRLNPAENRLVLIHRATALSLLLCAFWMIPAHGAIELVRPGGAAPGDYRPKNLARIHMGAQMMLAESYTATVPNEIATVLLTDDASLDFPLKHGSHRIVVGLKSIHALNLLTLVNKNTEGTLRVFTATAMWPFDSAHWKPAAIIKLETTGIVKGGLGFQESKFIRMDFVVSKPGAIASLGVFGDMQESEFIVRSKSKTNPVQDGFRREERGPVGVDHLNYDLAAAYADTEVLYVSSGNKGQDAGSMIDDRSDTKYLFEPEDSNPTVILDLHKVRSISRAVFQIDAPPGTMDVFFLKELPFDEIGTVESPQARVLHRGSRTAFFAFAAMGPVSLSQNTINAIAPMSSPPQKRSAIPERLVLGESFFQRNKATQTLETGKGELAISLDTHGAEARYMLLTWRPDDPQAGGRFFVVRKISVFGAPEAVTEQVEVIHKVDALGEAAKPASAPKVESAQGPLEPPRFEGSFLSF
jgi:hypothetical protein